MADGVKKIERNDLTSLVLPGAVAKGAYEAGVIEVLVENDVKIDRIVATSSGALNAIALAAGIRAGHERAMAKNLVTAWVEKGGWFDTFNFNPLNLLRGRGLSGHAGLSDLIKGVIKPCTHSEKKDIELRIIITPLYGVDGNIGDKVATTFEKVVSFTGEDFDTEAGLARIFEVTLAACSFPGIFSAVDVAGLGPCVDGGVVNNAPIHYAMDYSDVTHIIMPVPFPEIMHLPKSLGGFELLSHLIEILINERLYRDLKNAQTINADVKRLEDMVKKDQISPNQLAEIKKILGIRNINIHEVRPKESLKVGSFSGFFSKNDRMKLVDEGRAAMQAMLGEVRTT